jgi:uncharacterized membrane protein (UPF0127 family)
MAEPARHVRLVRMSLITAAIVTIFVAIFLNKLHQAPPTTPVKLGTISYNLETASSTAAKENGLGRRGGMPASYGMLFPYAISGQECYWMKNMRFSLDMIWLDSSRKVVRVVSDISPGTYPKSYCALSQYVIELNAGQAARAHILVGQTAYGL